MRTYWFAKRTQCTFRGGDKVSSKITTVSTPLHLRSFFRQRTWSSTLSKSKYRGAKHLRRPAVAYQPFRWEILSGKWTTEIRASAVLVITLRTKCIFNIPIATQEICSIFRHRKWKNPMAKWQKTSMLDWTWWQLRNHQLRTLAMCLLPTRTTIAGSL